MAKVENRVCLLLPVVGSTLTITQRWQGPLTLKSEDPILTRVHESSTKALRPATTKLGRKRELYSKHSSSSCAFSSEVCGCWQERSPSSSDSWLSNRAKLSRSTERTLAELIMRYCPSFLNPMEGSGWIELPTFSSLSCSWLVSIRAKWQSMPRKSENQPDTSSAYTLPCRFEPQTVKSEQTLLLTFTCEVLPVECVSCAACPISTTSGISMPGAVTVIVCASKSRAG
mmetsp:Transcript_7286/g.13830  ORF Transcript_7286/g.13830 Transcript_7286/m.13830 type:complete len:228 (-) Transcript_7286:1407-2090(-)